jgi:hypothetical protein
VVAGERRVHPCLQGRAGFVCAGPFVDYGEGPSVLCPGSSSSSAQQGSCSSSPSEAGNPIECECRSRDLLDAAARKHSGQICERLLGSLRMKPRSASSLAYFVSSRSLDGPAEREPGSLPGGPLTAEGRGGDSAVEAGERFLPAPARRGGGIAASWGLPLPPARPARTRSLLLEQGVVAAPLTRATSAGVRSLTVFLFCGRGRSPRASLLVGLSLIQPRATA